MEHSSHLSLGHSLISPSLPPHPPLIWPLSPSFVDILTLSLSASAPGLSCQPLVFLLPRPGTTGSPGNPLNSAQHTHTHSSGHHLVIWHPSGQGCVLCMFVGKISSSNKPGDFYLCSFAIFSIIFFSLGSQSCFITNTGFALLMQLPPSSSHLSRLKDGWVEQ